MERGHDKLSLRQTRLPGLSGWDLATASVCTTFGHTDGQGEPRWYRRGNRQGGKDPTTDKKVAYLVESKRSNADRQGPTGEWGERIRGGTEDRTGPKGKEKRRETDQISRAKSLDRGNTGLEREKGERGERRSR